MFAVDIEAGVGVRSLEADFDKEFVELSIPHARSLFSPSSERSSRQTIFLFIPCFSNPSGCIMNISSSSFPSTKAVMTSIP
jgi:hypothetical protein